MLVSSTGSDVPAQPIANAKSAASRIGVIRAWGETENRRIMTWSLPPRRDPFLGACRAGFSSMLLIE